MLDRSLFVACRIWPHSPMEAARALGAGEKTIVGATIRVRLSRCGSAMGDLVGGVLGPVSEETGARA